MSNVKFLTREQIFLAKSVKYEDVDMTDFGWPGKVRMAVFSSAMRDYIESELIGPDNQPVIPKNFRAKVVAASMIEPGSGELLFNPENEEDVAELNRKSRDAIDHLYDISTKLNKIVNAESIDGEVKNSSATQIDSLPTE